MRKIVVALIALNVWSTSTLAQNAPVDWCNQPLSVQADPGATSLWRLHCTIQILNQERTEAVDHATFVEIDKAVADAHLKEALDEVGALKKAKEEAEHKEAAPTPAPAPAPTAPAILPPHK